CGNNRTNRGGFQFAAARLPWFKAPVAKYGYVRTVVETADGDRVRYIKTNLLSEKEVVKLWHRYQSIRSGQVKTSCSCGGKFHM
ncbi:hypothetical protein SNB88_06220, partial [Escherichia coli]|nr:hypothetical protein [Escherichia coli]